MSSQCSGFILLTLFGALTITGGNGQFCDSALGFEDGGISDDQLTASSSSSTYTASQARLNVGKGWVPAAGTDYQYLLVDLLAQFNVTSYTVQGASQRGFVSNFTLHYSQDGLTWTTYTADIGTTSLSGTDAPEGVSSHLLVPAVKARFLSIQPLISGKGLRIELYGCRHERQEDVQFTLVDDRIDGYQDWLIEGSPYIVNSETEISPTARVRIHEGVKVVFNSSIAGLNIYGTLEATGTDFGHPLPFAHAPSQWKGIIIINQGTITLDNCSIFGARSGLSGAFSSMVISDSLVFENNVGIHLTEGASDGNFSISGTKVTGNSREGILFDESGPAKSWIVLEDCQILNNGNGFGFEASVTLIARNTSFSLNKGHGISNVNDSDFRISIYLDNCFFEENSKTGLYLSYVGSSSDSSLNLTILNSSFERNKHLAVFSSIRQSPNLFHMLLKDCYISENIASGVMVRLPEIGNGDLLVNIINNRFIDIDNKQPFRFHFSVDGQTTNSVHGNLIIKKNTFQNGISMRLTGNNNITYDISNNTITTSETWYDAAVMIEGGEVHLRDNTFINCTTRKVIKTESPVSLYRNIFLNPQAEFDLFVELDPYNFNSESLNASFNYWGTDDPRSRIRDFFKDSDQIIVLIEPVYATPEMDEFQSDSVAFNQTGNIAGGYLYQNEVVGAHQTLLVNKGIYVPEGLQLTILQGATLRFEPGTGIHVKGSLVIRGEESEKVVLKAVSEGKQAWWNGLRVDGTGSTISHAVLQNFKTTGSGSKKAKSFTIRDSLISDCYQAFSLKPLNDFNIKLNDVEIRNCDYWMIVEEITEDSTATVDANKCRIYTNEGIMLISFSTGHLNISIYNSILDAHHAAFELRSYTTAVSLNVQNTSLTKQTPYINMIDIMSPTVNMHFLGVDVTTRSSSIFVQSCPASTNTTSSVFEIRDSYFVVQDATSPSLNIGTYGEGSFNPLEVMVINNTFTTDSDSPSVAIKTTGTRGITVSHNTFHETGITIDSDADFVHLTRNVYNGRYYKVEIHSVDNATNLVLTGNELKGYDGQLTMSAESSGSIDMYDNIVRNALVNISASEISMSMNTFEDSTIELDTMRGISAPIASTSTSTLGDRDTELGSRAGDCTVTENLFQRSRLIFTDPHTAIHRNKFYDIRQMINLEFNGYCYSEMTINCSHNFWDTRHGYEISSRIYDSTDNKNLPVITFEPFYLYSNFTHLQEDLVSSGSFLSPTGTIGGSIGGHVTLTANGSPYIVTKDILVDKQESLTLEAGVTLLFSRNLGLTVRGKLRVLGNSSHPVYASPRVDGNRWFGVRLLETKHAPVSLTPEVRLVGACPGKEGRVEVKMEGAWKPVCGEDFDQQDARVVCRGLGYDPTENHVVLIDSSASNGTIDAVFHCDGTEGSLLECPMVPYDCSDQPSAYLRCTNKKLPRIEDIGNEVELNHFIINDTQIGLEVNGNISYFQHVESSFSMSVGITFLTGELPSQITAITATSNKNSGIYFPSSNDGIVDIGLDNCNISNNEVGVRINRRVNISIESCNFEGNSDVIYLREGSLISISSSTFEMNNGVFKSSVTDFEGELSFALIDSVVSGSRDEQGVMFFRPAFTNKCTFVISNNIFSFNSGNLIYFSFYGAENDSFVHIENNSFIENNATFVEVSSPMKNRLTFDLSNNVITGNSPPHSLIKMNFETRTPEMQSLVNISGNHISNNEAQYLIDIHNPRSHYSKLNIVNNRFIDNICTTTIRVSSFEVSLTSNVLMNPEAQCELEYPVFRRNVDIDARLNYWGRSSPEGVSRRICGFHSDMSKGVIFYSPYYDSKELDEILGDTSDQFWTDSRQASGGLVESELFLGKDKSPYTIERSVYIRNGGELHIASGVELRFKPNTGIYVDGVLKAQSETPENTVFRRADNSPWYGVVFPLMLVTEANTGRVRLVDPNERHEGQVEMCINGTWTRVCEVQYPDEKLVCRAVGYESGSRSARSEEVKDEDRGSVVTDLGCGTQMWSLLQCRPTLAHNISVCNDVRVGCHQNIAVSTDHHVPDSSLEGVAILDSKVGLVISSPTVRVSNCYINNTVEAGITFREDLIDIDLNGTLVEHGQSDGILVKVETYFNVRNGIVRNNRRNGMTVTTYLIKGNIEGMSFIDNRVGLEVAGFTSGDRFLIINNNVFRGQDIGLLMDMGVHDSNGWINIISNEFVDNANSLDVKLFGSAYFAYYRELHVYSNNFTSSGEISFVFESSFQLFFETNIAKNVVSDSCFVSMDLYEFDELSVSANQFENISAECVVKVETSSPNKINFDSNSIKQCNTRDASVMLDFKNTSFSYNIFENPVSPYDLRVLSKGEITVNVTNNWWDGQNETEASSRVVDKDDNFLPGVSLSPVLSNLDFDCSDSEHCTNRGRCVGPGICWCKLGFTGKECSEFDCSGVWNCSSHGTCVGPNQCECQRGWEGRVCDKVVQDDRDICSTASTMTFTPSTSTSATSSSTISSSIRTTTSSQTDVSGAEKTSCSIQNFILILGSVFMLVNE